MGATELIEQLKALSAKEREVFARLFCELEKPAGRTENHGAFQTNAGEWPDFGARLKRIYGNKLVSESESVVSWARGDQ